MPKRNLADVAGESPVKQRLLELAIQSIDESGETSVRVNQLAEAGGVTLATLYHHFGSREGLIEEAQAERFIRAFRADVENLVSALAGCKTKKDLVRELRRLFAARRGDERSLVRWQRLNALGASYARPTLAAKIVRAHDDLVTQVALALLPFQRQGFIRGDIDLRAVVAWYNGAVIGKNLIEIAESSIDVSEWDRTLDEAVLMTLFGADN